MILVQFQQMHLNTNNMFTHRKSNKNINKYNFLFCYEFIKANAGVTF